MGVRSGEKETGQERSHDEFTEEADRIKVEGEERRKRRDEEELVRNKILVCINSIFCSILFVLKH